MHALALLGFADAVGGGCVGDRHWDLGLRAAAHSALAANHGGRLFGRGGSSGRVWSEVGGL